MVLCSASVAIEMFLTKIPKNVAEKVLELMYDDADREWTDDDVEVFERFPVIDLTKDSKVIKLLKEIAEG